MDQAGILAMIAIPLAGFWTALSMEGRPKVSLIGNTKRIVEWLSSFSIQCAAGTTLVLAVTSTLCSLYLLFDFVSVQARGLVPWYFGICLAMIAFECVVIGTTKLFLHWGKKEGLLE